MALVPCIGKGVFAVLLLAGLGFNGCQGFVSSSNGQPSYILVGRCDCQGIRSTGLLAHGGELPLVSYVLFDSFYAVKFIG